jgi:hypothetical protein
MLTMILNAVILAIAILASYHFCERWFLKFKERFETVLSRPA